MTINITIKHTAVEGNMTTLQHAKELSEKQLPDHSPFKEMPDESRSIGTVSTKITSQCSDK